MKLFADDSSLFTEVNEIQGIQSNIERNLGLFLPGLTNGKRYLILI